MSRIALLAFLLLFGPLCGLCRPDDNSDKIAIQRAKSTLVSTIDPTLPKVTLQFFLEYEAAGSPVHWEVNDCGEQSGNPSADRGRDFPVCVEADFTFKHQDVTVSIAMGTVGKGLNEAPELFSLMVSDMGGSSHPLRRLGELPMQLRRPLRRAPRDVPAPSGML